MARSYAPFRGNGRRTAKRSTSWAQFQIAEASVNNSSVLIFSLNATALALRPFTVVRSHVELMLRSDQEAAVEDQAAAFGIAVVSDEAVAVGVTAIPTPLDNAASELWLMHSFMFGEESRLVDKALPPAHKTLDSKAMRIVQEGQDIVWVCEGGTIGDGFILSVAGRMLFKLH